MNYLYIFLLAILAYVLGSFPSGYVLAKHIKKVDITTYGSKHTGATNTTRVLGIGYGLLALLIDALKGIVLLIVLVSFKLEHLYIINGVNILLLYGLISALGHVFSIFLKFKGGKAVATSFGILSFTAVYLGRWELVVVTLLIFVLVTIITKYISLSSIIGSLSAVITALIFYLIDQSVPLEFLLGIAILCLIIIIKHKENIVRLLNGNENKFSIQNKK